MSFRPEFVVVCSHVTRELISKVVAHTELPEECILRWKSPWRGQQQNIEQGGGAHDFTLTSRCQAGKCWGLVGTPAGPNRSPLNPEPDASPRAGGLEHPSADDAVGRTVEPFYI